ncbi:MAG: tRNA (adenosine(37)-N6)-threonylcarbamoyltransferase complex dimerization subunit type 1 TsaB [Casimicrobiaceae bacterium]
MLVLAFDTSTSWCSVAVGDGRAWLAAEEDVGQGHSARLLPMAQALLAQGGWRMAAVDGFAFGAGPGTFTGIRIGCGVAQGLAYGLDRPVVPVPTLAAIAQEARRLHATNAVVAALDARMHEVYVAAYRHDGARWQECMAPAVLPPAEVRVAASAPPWRGAGNGFAAYPELAERLGIAVDPGVRPTGRAVGELGTIELEAGNGMAAERALPVYVRHRVALTTAERESGLKL